MTQHELHPTVKEDFEAMSDEQEQAYVNAMQTMLLDGDGQ